jgi:hypothetical protein
MSPAFLARSTSFSMRALASVMFKLAFATRGCPHRMGGQRRLPLLVGYGARVTRGARVTATFARSVPPLFAKFVASPVSYGYGTQVLHLTKLPLASTEDPVEPAEA